MQSVSTMGSAPNQCPGNVCGRVHVWSVHEVTAARLAAASSCTVGLQTSLVSCKMEHWSSLLASNPSISSTVAPVSLHTWQHSGPVMWAATLASAQQSICVIADVSGDICIHGSTVAQLCEQQPWHQLNSHSVSLQTCLVTFAYMAAQWPQICEQQPWHQLNSPIVSLQTCLVTFAYMAAQWPSFVGSKGSSSLCSQQAWPQGPRSLWDWLVQWNTCRRFDDDYLVLWGARYH